ncbi:MAG: hypothetical protein RI897_609 [Verrucomicrobiota bacterium]
MALEAGDRVDFHGTAAHVAGAGVEAASVEEGVIEDLGDFAPSFGNVVGDGAFEVGGAEEAGPALVTGGRVSCGGWCEGEGHPGIAEEFAVGVALEGEGIGWDEQAVAELGDSELVIGEGFVVVEEGPAGGAHLVVVALRSGIEAELGWAVAEVVSGPVTEAAFESLEDTGPGGAAFLPGAGQRAFRGEGLVFVIRVIGRDPGAGESDLEIREGFVDQGPDGGIESHAGVEAGVGGGAVVAEADIAVKAVVVGGDFTGLGGGVGGLADRDGEGRGEDEGERVDHGWETS